LVLNVTEKIKAAYHRVHDDDDDPDDELMIIIIIIIIIRIWSQA